MTVSVFTRITVLALAFVALLAPASASGFFTQLEHKSRSSASTSEAKQITVSCPSGKRVVGAGAVVSLGGEVLIDAIRPNASLTRVTARAREDESGVDVSWLMTASAVCAPPPSGLALVTATSGSTSQPKAATAACPGAKRLLGTGGEITSPNGQVLLDGVTSDSDLTQATVNALEDETGNAQDWTVSAYAICADPVEGLERVSTVLFPSSSESQFANRDCPVGKTLISANGTIDSVNGQVVLHSLAADAFLTTAQISADEDETGLAADWGLTVHAICASSANRGSSITGPTSTEPTTLAGACGSGRQATGVGGEVTAGVGQVWLRGVWFEPSEFRMSAAPDETGVSSGFAVAAHGICATTIEDLEVVTASSLTNSFSPKQQVATCPEGLRVLGGGASTSNNANFVLQAIRPDAGLTSVTANAREDRTGSAAGWQLKAFAVCAPPPPGLQLVERGRPFGSEEFESATAVCPDGKHLIGTGAEIVDGLGRVGFDDIRPDAALTRTTVAATEDEVGLGSDWRPIAYSICIDR